LNGKELQGRDGGVDVITLPFVSASACSQRVPASGSTREKDKVAGVGGHQHAPLNCRISCLHNVNLGITAALYSADVHPGFPALKYVTCLQSLPWPKS
jgi:hypothetical protein